MKRAVFNIPNHPTTCFNPALAGLFLEEMLPFPTSNRLKRQNTMIPSDVSQLAREHQRLLKESADMHYNLGVLFSQQKEFQRAEIEFRKTIELRPDDADAHYNLGVIYAEHVPNKEKAMANFRRYLQLTPRASDASWVKQYIASQQAWEAKEFLE